MTKTERPIFRLPPSTLPAATVRPALLGTFHDQAHQYPRRGTPGMTHRVEFAPSHPDSPIDCLLAYDRRGNLIGILNHFGVALPPFEKAGDVSMWVHPRHQRAGVGSTLLREALHRWSDIDLAKQHFTPAGRALAEAVQR